MFYHLLFLKICFSGEYLHDDNYRISLYFFLGYFKIHTGDRLFDSMEVKYWLVGNPISTIFRPFF